MSIVVIEATLREGLAAFDGLGSVVKFDCGEDGIIVIDARKPPASLFRDEVAEADCALLMAVETLQRILDRELDPTSAFMSGRLRVRGKLGIAMQLASILR